MLLARERPLRAARAADTPGSHNSHSHQRQREHPYQYQRQRATILYPILWTAARTTTGPRTTTRYTLIRLTIRRSRAGPCSPWR